MVGLSVILENHKSSSSSSSNNYNNDMIMSEKIPQVISKTTMLINTNKVVSQLNQPLPVFLQQCFLCKHKLLPGKDIYMYKGDKGFCSVECRCRQILMDEEESLKNSSFVKPSTSSSSATRNRRKVAARNGDGGGFVY